ncbi:uncharacterized protein G2W53_041951 [Senna tora]|uniref:GRF-type domain-containing protein n=1 Tax=Senna tora TaxID=362788 RepID=A0A834SEK0_9FABA|nr:uncharacterized protein G2W53_041951 [Senna tora]
MNKEEEPSKVALATKWKYYIKGKKERCCVHTMSDLHSSVGSIRRGRHCFCGERAIILTSRTQENPGRRFWRCKNFKSADDCDIFDWIDLPSMDAKDIAIERLRVKISTLNVVKHKFEGFDLYEGYDFMLDVAAGHHLLLWPYCLHMVHLVLYPNGTEEEDDGIGVEGMYSSGVFLMKFIAVIEWQQGIPVSIQALHEHSFFCKSTTNLSVACIVRIGFSLKSTITLLKVFDMLLRCASQCRVVLNLLLLQNLGDMARSCLSAVPAGPRSLMRSSRNQDHVSLLSTSTIANATGSI